MSLTNNNDHLSPIISKAEATGQVDRNIDGIFYYCFGSNNFFPNFATDSIAKIQK
jgi:hypothetical protein